MCIKWARPGIKVTGEENGHTLWQRTSFGLTGGTFFSRNALVGIGFRNFSRIGRANVKKCGLCFKTEPKLSASHVGG